MTSPGRRDRLPPSRSKRPIGFRQNVSNTHAGARSFDEHQDTGEQRADRPAAHRSDGRARRAPFRGTCTRDEVSSLGRRFDDRFVGGSVLSDPVTGWPVTRPRSGRRARGTRRIWAAGAGHASCQAGTRAHGQARTDVAPTPDGARRWPDVGPLVNGVCAGPARLGRLRCPGPPLPSAESPGHCTTRASPRPPRTLPCREAR